MNSADSVRELAKDLKDLKSNAFPGLKLSRSSSIKTTHKTAASKYVTPRWYVKFYPTRKTQIEQG